MTVTPLRDFDRVRLHLRTAGGDDGHAMAACGQAFAQPGHDQFGAARHDRRVDVVDDEDVHAAALQPAAQAARHMRAVAGQHGADHVAAGRAAANPAVPVATGARVRPASSTRTLPSTKRDSSTPIGASEAAGEAITTRSKRLRSRARNSGICRSVGARSSAPRMVGKRHLVQSEPDHAGDRGLDLRSPGSRWPATVPGAGRSSLAHVDPHADAVDEQHALAEPGGADVGEIVDDGLDGGVGSRAPRTAR